MLLNGENQGAKSRIFLYEAAAWCRGRNGLIRLPLLLWFGYVFFKYLSDANYQSILSPLNLSIHEAGHLLFSYFGTFFSIVGGTVLECLFPVLGMFHFYRQKDFFAIAMSFGWLSTVLFGVARYAADAQEMTIPLVSLSWDATVKHDWNYILSQIGFLHYDFAVAFLFRGIAGASMLVCLGFGSWLLWRMIAVRD